MRLFGLSLNIERGSRAPLGPQIVAPSPDSGIATSLRSWEYPFRMLLNNYVPLTQNYQAYDAIREGIPFVDAALRKLARMCSGFAVSTDSDVVTAEVNAWLSNVRFGDVLSGFDTFEYAYVNSLCQYGKALCEITLMASQRDVWSLYMVPVKQVRLVTTPDGLQLGEDDGKGSVVPYARQDLFAYSAMNVEGDNPHGVSMLRSLQFVTNIALVMENALRQRWMRSGAPSFLLVDKLPADMTGADANADNRSATIRSEWNSAQRARWNQEGVMDFVVSTQGDFRVDPIESRTELEFTHSLRAMQEQIVSTVELAPFMLGLQWSTTERLSQQQADMIVSTIGAIRREVEPAYMRIVDWFMKTRGYRVRAVPVWPDVSLADAVLTAQAESLCATARKVQLDTALLAWQNGMVDQAGAMELAELEGEPVTAMAEPVVPASGNQVAAMAAAQRAWEKY